MKVCINCQYVDKVSMQVGHGQYALVPTCRHPENVDPVDGEAILCKTARTNEVFCGINAKHYRAAEKQPKKEEKVASIVLPE